uniref:PAS domain-containing protein n=1 Tax=Helicotheca tamesis TaxID=374047 RepID=A0A7S2HLW3_9STRA
MLSSRIIATVIAPKGRIILASTATKAIASMYSTRLFTSTTSSSSQQKAIMRRKKIPKSLESLEPIVPEYDPPTTRDGRTIDEVFAKIGEDDTAPLPNSFDEAMDVTMSNRAIIITEKTPPFRVVAVNQGWENLCGYTQDEARGKTIGQLLQGPETDHGASTALISQLLRGEEAATVLTNYTKEGRKFQNRVRLGPIYKDMNEKKISHYVGVLREIAETRDHFVEDLDIFKKNPMLIDLGPV